MTCYNSIDHFRASMESALQQDYPSIELVVVDGGSTDGTAELIKEYDEQLRADDYRMADGRERRMRYVSERDRGIYDGMNKGVHMATGDVIAVFNDLFTRTDAVSMLIAALEESGADGVHSDLIYAEGDACKRLWRMGNGRMKETSDRTIYPGIHIGWMPAHPTLYLRRAVYEQYGDYDLSLPVSADFDYMLRMLTGQNPIRLAYVPEVLISMFYGGTSNNGLKGYPENIREAYVALWRNHVAFPFTAILCRTVRTLIQYRDAHSYMPDNNS